MKKLLTLLAIVLTIQCMAQTYPYKLDKDTIGEITWYENEYRNPNIENVDSIISMMDSMFPPSRENRSRLRSWRRFKYLVDTCPEGTTWGDKMVSSGCEVEAGCYTQEQKRYNYEWFYKCEYGEGSNGITALKSLYDFTVIADGKTITGKLDKNKSNDIIVKFHNVPETPITIEDIEKYIKDCYNDSTAVGIRINTRGRGNRVIHRHIEPTFEGFYKWLKDK